MARAETHDSASADRILAEDYILAELQSSAKTGDLHRFEGALAKWDNDGALALRNVLSIASKAGHADIVTHLLENTNGACKVTAPALRWASSRKHWAVIQAFVDAGWDINSPMEGGNTCPILKSGFPPTLLKLVTDNITGKLYQVKSTSTGISIMGRILHSALPGAITIFPALPGNSGPSER